MEGFALTDSVFQIRFYKLMNLYFIKSKAHWFEIFFIMFS